MKSATTDLPIELHDKCFELSISEVDLEARINTLGQAITSDMGEKDPLVLVVLKGAFVFAADLLRALEFDPEVEFIFLSSYKGMESSGDVKLLRGFDVDRVKGRTILVVEDIIETGTTIRVLNDFLRENGAVDVRLATLLFKPASLKEHTEPDYVGFEIAREFVVGYGLDYEQRGRSLPRIYKLKAEG